MRFEEKIRKYLAYFFIPNTAMGFLINALIAGLLVVVVAYSSFQGTFGFLCFIGLLICYTLYWRVVYKKLFGKEKSSVDIKVALCYSVILMSGFGLLMEGSLWIFYIRNFNYELLSGLPISTELELTLLILITIATTICMILGIYGLNRTDKKIPKAVEEK